MPVTIPDHLVERYRIFEALPDICFQVQLYDWLRVHQPRVVVETGINTAVGSIWILRALELGPNHVGRLYSVEHRPQHYFSHEQWTTFIGPSHEKLLDVYRKSGRWQFFIHDSDHEVGCTTFEYELAWRLTDAGGHIASDDIGWGTPPHFAWQAFCKRYNLKPIVLGSIEIVQKPATAERPIVGDNAWLLKQHRAAAELANAACKEYGVEPYLALK